MEGKEIFNFSPGPACLPKEVLKQIQDEFLNYKGKGFSIIEMFNRSKEFLELAAEVEKDLRSLINLPDNYAAMWASSGAYLQFSSVPLNIGGGPESTATYVETGHWSMEAAKEARKFLNVSPAWQPSEDRYLYTLPEPEEFNIHKDSKYVYYCDNETVHGVEYHTPIVTEGVPVVCDMTSSFLTKPLNWDRFDVIVSAVQKNLGPAGITSLIVNKKLLGNKRADTPIMCDWETQYNCGGFYNTANVFALYVCGLNLKYLKKFGLEYFDDLAKQRSTLIYDVIDSSNGFYRNQVDLKHRSRLNCQFRLKSKEEDDKFLKTAEEAGFLWLNGHIKYGGCRANMYNAMPIEGAEKLRNFMKQYQDEQERL
ncbi:phosphoserine aminotransferase [Stylonychia lemnae]|uniref:phosphoserine transaminase n=1 Tax=Stylonychia lemnae TaxID=5949 RepID=A0A078A1Q4_STYLE|nr:phosphoserine aminotransferase [Stylonychia lemnae]|eukprot:CDW76040.1 phosphoserine aminotransferase [Stylonychia lemnae]